MHHASVGKQRQTCVKCVVETFGRCVKAGMPREHTWRAVVAVSKTYRCPFCIKDAIMSSSFGAHTLKLFRSCREHRAKLLQKACPCGSPWADCLRCKDDGIDPRAGSAYCADCRLRHGRSSDGRFCRCRQRLAAAQTPPRAAAAQPADELAAAAIAADSDGASSGDGACEQDADGLESSRSLDDTAATAAAAWFSEAACSSEETLDADLDLCSADSRFLFHDSAAAAAACCSSEDALSFEETFDAALDLSALDSPFDSDNAAAAAADFQFLYLDAAAALDLHLGGLDSDSSLSSETSAAAFAAATAGGCFYEAASEARLDRWGDL